MKARFSKIIWGVFLLLTAAFVLTNQFSDFAGLGAGGIIAAVLSLMVIVHCIADLNFALLPVPLAVLYIVFQTPFNLPYVKHWPLMAASILAFIGLSVLLPKHQPHASRRSEHSESHVQMQTESGPKDNNPSVSVNFGTVSRRLHAESLETANLRCNFGVMEVYFDQVELSSSGAEAILNCSFGLIELLVPKQWRIVNRLACTLGGVSDHGIVSPEENAPHLTLTGNISFGGVDIRYI